MELRRALAHEVAQAFELQILAPVIAYIAEEDDEIIGAGGLAFFDGPRCWVFFMANDKASKHPFTVVRMGRELKKTARAMGFTEAYVTCDVNYETAPRLVSLLGFKKTDEIHQGLEVFKCQL